MIYFRHNVPTTKSNFFVTIEQICHYKKGSQNKLTQAAITYLMLIIETLEQDKKYIQS